MISVTRSVLFGAAAGAALSLSVAAGSASASTNVIATHWNSVTSNGSSGALRAGSPWGPGSNASSVLYPVDGVFETEGAQWNHNSFWWDQDSSVNPSQVYLIINLDHAYTFDSFKVQADDNDSYLLQAWVGGAWQDVWSVPTSCCWGLVTRDSGAIAPVTTNRLRFTGTGGDNYYAVSEIQGFGERAGVGGVPEPASWAMMIMGFGLLGAATRRSRRTAIA